MEDKEERKPSPRPGSLQEAIQKAHEAIDEVRNGIWSDIEIHRDHYFPSILYARLVKRKHY